MRVLVTGGSGLHRLARRRQAARRRPRAAHLRPRPLAAPLAGAGRLRAGDITDLDALARGRERLRRDHPPRRGRRRQRRRRRPARRPSESTPEGTLEVLEAARHAGVDASSTAARSGSTATARSATSTRRRRWPRRATSTRRPSSPASMYCKSYSRALRGRLHDPALRHPVRATGPRRDGRRRVRAPRQRTANRSPSRATAASRGASSTSRTSPRASSPPFAPRPRTGSTTSPGRAGTTILEIAEAVRDHVSRHRHRSTPPGAPDFGGKGCPANAPPRSSGGPRAPGSRRASVATCTGGATGPARGRPGPLRRHRRGP